jgi:hypothetical protein
MSPFYWSTISHLICTSHSQSSKITDYNVILFDFQDVEKFSRQKRDSAATTTTMSTTLWSSEDVVDEASFVPMSPMAADNDSGIDRVRLFTLKSPEF